MKVVAFSGSLRRESFNKKFAAEALRMLQEKFHAEGQLINLADYDLPVFNQDFEQKSGIPKTVADLSAIIKSADALVVSAPEYNGSISGALKNTIDWLSRERPHSLLNKRLLLLGASPGALGAVRGLWHTRVPFEALGVHVYPTMMGLPGAGEAFEEKGHLKEEKYQKQLLQLLEGFVASLPKI